MYKRYKKEIKKDGSPAVTSSSHSENVPQNSEPDKSKTSANGRMNNNSPEVKSYNDDYSGGHEHRGRPLPALTACLLNHSASSWPVRNYNRTNFNVNSSHGGATSLVFVWNVIWDVKDETTAQISLLRSGFDGNHHSNKQLAKHCSSKFGCETSFRTDEKGVLTLDCLFGKHTSMVLSNDCSQTTCANGYVLMNESFPFPVNFSTGGLGMLLCSAPGISGLYLIRFGTHDDKFNCNLIHGKDEWTFEVIRQRVKINGPNQSRFAFWITNEEHIDQSMCMGDARVRHSQSFDGGKLELLRADDHGLLLVLCSTSLGIEDQTVSSIYALTVHDENLTSELIIADSCAKENPTDLWQFTLENESVFIQGPKTPSRIAILSNYVENEPDPALRCQQYSCLATGNDRQIKGEVVIDLNGVRGRIDSPMDIVVYLEGMKVVTLKPAGESGGRFAFKYEWKEEEKKVGLKMVRVFAEIRRKSDGEKLEVELPGSPYQLLIQPPGVLYSVNCCGPSYQANNDVIYQSEFSRFANYDSKHGGGSRYKCLGGDKRNAFYSCLVTGTYDGRLYRMARSTRVEADQEKRVVYDVKDLSDGKRTLRLHVVDKGCTVLVDGRDVTNEIKSQLDSQKEFLTGYHAHQVDLPVTVKTGKLKLDVKSGMLSGFAIFDENYREKKKSSEEVKKEQSEKNKLVDEASPLSRIVVKKEIKIAGWSPNLLQNASGEEGLKFWHISGSFEVRDGGHGTEKAFATSHMECTKYQIVELTEHFTEEYLDTAPEIAVEEWYKEGCGGGGFYQFWASLLNKDGDEVASYTSDRIGSIYSKEWFVAQTSFSGYGQGVRAVMIKSMGKDDKYWAGHWGSVHSAAKVRVKRQTIAASNDSFADINRLGGKEANSFRDQLILRILNDNKDALDELSSHSSDAAAKTTKAAIMQEASSHNPPSGDSMVLPAHTGVTKTRRKRREIRVFVSSTFRDFKDERELLIKKVFRELNALCAERGVFFTYVDLRWGITTDQTINGKTIAICLQEIDRCRPYFLSMLGHRYGWSQKSSDEKDDQLDASYNYAVENFAQTMAWIDEHRYGASVTKLEVLHGALNSPEATNGRAFFYLREPARREDCADENDYKSRSPESPWHADHQDQLRSLVTRSSLPVKRYSNAKQVADHVLCDLKEAIDEDFPPGSQLSALQKEKESHQAFADARRLVYIGSQEYFDQLDDHLTKPCAEQPMVILGQSGSGKSALVANWQSRAEEKFPDAFHFLHFIGSSAGSASYTKMIRRLLEEIKLFFGFDFSLPSTDTNLIQELPKWLTMAGSHRKCVIVLDALNQLDDGSGSLEGPEHDLLWIPKPLPKGVYMVLSTLPGRAYDAVVHHQWPSMKVHPLNAAQKEEIIVGYLEKLYVKTLSEEQRQLIVSAEQTENPLYLRSLLDEIRVFGSFEQLTSKLNEYLEADTPGDLFEKVLERLELDFETEKGAGEQSRPGLVRETTTAIWCSSRGMAEDELREFLDVPSAVWSPFFLCLVDSLVNRNGILNFFHDFLRQAVEHRYLKTQEDKKNVYKKLAAFFDKMDVCERKVEELPHLLLQAEEFDELKKVITNLEVFSLMNKDEDRQFELIRAWQKCGGFAQAEEAYNEAVRTQLKGSKEPERIVFNLGDFFDTVGLLPAARHTYDWALQMAEGLFRDQRSEYVYSDKPADFTFKLRTRHSWVVECLQRLGEVCEQQRDLEAAENYYLDALDRQARVNGPQEELVYCKGILGLATVKTTQEQASEAKKLLIRARQVASDLLGDRHHYVAAIVNKLGQMTYKQGRLGEALGFFVQDLHSTRSDVGSNHPRVAQILNDIALVYDDSNDVQACSLYESALGMLLDLYGDSHVDVGVVRYNLGAYYFATDYFARAAYQFTQALRIFKSFLGDSHPYTEATKDAFAALPKMEHVT